MSFDSRVIAFADRFLSDRTFELIVAPALADLHYAPGTGRLDRAAGRLAVLRAVAGGLRHDAMRGSGSFLALTLMCACYYIVPLIIVLDFVNTSIDFVVMASSILGLSLGPVAVLFWPSRRRVRPVD